MLFGKVADSCNGFNYFDLEAFFFDNNHPSILKHLD